ncbi:GET complex subunit GET1 [Rhodotorula paludigena]|uniref:GET complex subunit GET1 n=1 Tax=Rhodotorula paludigena TaxID=86838 RepID=UPI00317198B2
MELMLWLLLSTLVIEVISWVGSDALANLVYAPFSPTGKQNSSKKAEILQLRAELAATSSQDEFSKWARIRRKLDKAVQELETLNAGSSAHRKKFASTFKSALWVVTTVLPFIVSSWNRKAPVFWLPEGWFGPLGWWLSCPSAPAGAVAVTVWTMACRRTLNQIKTAVVAFIPTPEERTVQQLAEEQVKQAKQSEKKVKVGVTAAGGEEKVKDEL